MSRPNDLLGFTRKRQYADNLAESRAAEGEHVKEVYAYFGLAFYQANVLETGLALAVLHLDFMVATVRRLNRGGAASFDRAAYEAAFDAFMDSNTHSPSAV